MISNNLNICLRSRKLRHPRKYKRDTLITKQYTHKKVAIGDYICEYSMWTESPSSLNVILYKCVKYLGALNKRRVEITTDNVKTQPLEQFGYERWNCHVNKKMLEWCFFEYILKIHRDVISHRLHQNHIYKWFWTKM